MNIRRQAKLVHEGQFVAQVEVDLVETDSGWSPYLSLDDAYKLDDVREALRRGDIQSASRKAQVFRPHPRRPVTIRLGEPQKPPKPRRDWGPVASYDSWVS